MSEKRIRLQVVNHAEIGRIQVYELREGDKPLGDNKRYYHPDCEIWMKGRINSTVGYNLMLALQDRHMPVRSLILTKTR